MLIKKNKNYEVLSNDALNMVTKTISKLQSLNDEMDVNIDTNGKKCENLTNAINKLDLETHNVRSLILKNVQIIEKFQNLIS